LDTEVAPQQNRFKDESIKLWHNAWRGAHPRAAVEVGKMQSAERITAGVGIRTNVSTRRKSNSVGITAAIGGVGGWGDVGQYVSYVDSQKAKERKCGRIGFE
jgi:hypothetical protein